MKRFTGIFFGIISLLASYQAHAVMSWQVVYSTPEFETASTFSRSATDNLTGASIAINLAAMWNGAAIPVLTVTNATCTYISITGTEWVQVLNVTAAANFGGAVTLNSNGTTLSLGTGTDVANAISFSGGRGYVGYEAGAPAKIYLKGGAGKGLKLYAGSTNLGFELDASGNADLNYNVNVDGNTTGFKERIRWGTGESSINTLNQYYWINSTTSGYEAPKAGSIIGIEAYMVVTSSIDVDGLSVGINGTLGFDGGAGSTLTIEADESASWQSDYESRGTSRCTFSAGDTITVESKEGLTQGQTLTVYDVYLLVVYNN